MPIKIGILTLLLFLSPLSPVHALDPHVGTYRNQYGKIVIRHINPGNYSLVVTANKNQCVFRVAVSPMPPDEKGTALCANAREKQYKDVCVTLTSGILLLDQEKTNWEKLDKNCRGLKDAGEFVRTGR